MFTDPRCSITMDGELTVCDDFIAVICKDDGNVEIIVNTDALTLGMAMKLVAKTFVEVFEECTSEEQDEIASILQTVGGSDE